MKALILVLVLLAGCMSSTHERWEGPPDADASGSVDVAGFNEHAEAAVEDWERSPLTAAAEFLRLDEVVAQRIALVHQGGPEGGPRALVTATEEGLLDDSVRAVRYILLLELDDEDEAWRLRSAVRTQQCVVGRGHQSFGPDPCV